MNQKRNEKSGLPSGFHELDRLTSGWQRSSLVMVSSRHATGKTAFALSMARNMSFDYSIPVCMFSLETDNLQLVKRLLKNVSQAAEETGGTLADAIQGIEGVPLYIDDTPSLRIGELRSKAEEMVRGHGVKVIMIDCLELMDTECKGSEEASSSLLAGLKAMAEDLGVCIILLSQTRRTEELREPGIDDLRNPEAVERHADTVLFIHRPECCQIPEDGEGNELRGMARIIIARNKGGQTGTVWLRFSSEHSSFSNPDQPQE